MQLPSFSTNVLAVFLIKVIGIHTKVLYTHEELDEIEKIEKSLSTYLIFSQQKKMVGFGSKANGH